MEAQAKKTITCDACKGIVDLRKPKKDEPPNDGIVATLNTNNIIGETHDYHFCNEDCLHDFLVERRSRKVAAAQAKAAGIVELDIPSAIKQAKVS